MAVGVPRVCGLAAPTTTMGRPNDDQDRRMTPPAASRRWLWRALVSALAGSGITAASLGPVSSGLAAEGTTGTGEGTVTTTTPGEEASEATKTEATTTTTTPTSSAPAPSST